MRPVNLLPPESRRGEGAPSRAGALSYVVVGALAVAVLGMAGLTLSKKSVDDKETEVAALESQEAELSARAASLASFTEFQSVAENRKTTVTALAESRFDWERVMRELALVLPERAWLVNLTGTVSPGVAVQDAANIGIRQQVPGPAIELIGCARSQRDVARLISSLGDIDGVTRVTAEQSEKPTSDAQGEQSGKANEECRTRNFIAKFKVVAAFDSVPVPEGATLPPAPESPAPAAGESQTTSTPTPAGGEATETTEAKQSVDKANGKVNKAAGLVGAGGE